MTDDCDHARCCVQFLGLDRDRRVGRDDVGRVLDAKLCNECAIGGQHVHRLAHLDADDSALDDGDGGASDARSKSL